MSVSYTHLVNRGEPHLLIGKMIQERPFIEMKFEAAVQKAHLVFLRAGLIILFQEPVLPVY